MKADVICEKPIVINPWNLDALEPGRAGGRAQAVDADGKLADDFRAVEGEAMLHVLNAPAPAATASIAIGEYLAAAAERTFRAPSRSAG